MNQSKLLDIKKKKKLKWNPVNANFKYLFPLKNDNLKS